MSSIEIGIPSFFHSLSNPLRLGIQDLSCPFQLLNIHLLLGVRQGFSLSPFLFNLYAGRIFKEATEELDIGVKINGVPVSTIKGQLYVGL